MITDEEVAEVADALRYIPADARDTWVRMGMACRSASDDLFEIWDAWSQTGDGYNEKDAQRAWRSFKPGGNVTLGSLFYTAMAHGWTRPEKRDAASDAEAARQRAKWREAKDREKTKRRRAQAAAEAVKHAEAKRRATQMMAAAQPDVHPYLASKGFPEARMLVAGDLLVVPMRDVATNDICSVQTITPDGEKRFLSGGRKRGTAFQLGNGRELWLCEGLATAMSIQVALRAMQRQQWRVVVCFDAYNMVAVADALRQRYGLSRGVAVPDNDPWRCQRGWCRERWWASEGQQQCPNCGGREVLPPTGQRQAQQTGLLVYVPDGPGDVNDLHQEHGAEWLADAFRRFLGVGDPDSDSHGSCRRCGSTTIRRLSDFGYRSVCISCGSNGHGV